MNARKRIALWLCPDLNKSQLRLDHMRSELDSARWWLASEFPDVAGLAEWVLERDYWWVTSKRLPDRNAWAPPAHVTDISSYREWLREKARREALSRNRKAR